MNDVRGLMDGFASRGSIIVSLVFLTACGSENTTSENAQMSGWAITSPGIVSGGAIPLEYTCDGREFAVAAASPRFDWGEGPAGTQSYALVAKHLAIVEGLPPTDPNYFKGFMWVIWDIPANIRSLPVNLSRAQLPPEVPGAQQWAIRHQFGWFAPCPNGDPAPVLADPTTRKTEEYGFQVYALSTPTLDLPPKEADVANYAWTLTKKLDAVNIGTTMLRSVSDAVSGAAPVPVDASTLQYPVPVQ
jgi:phosphatidylethanolamine-binding protein (PEBP) family uncharacterized protein